MKRNTKRQPVIVPRHPLQPFIIDEHGIRRFKANGIVQFLLECGPFDMNDLARRGFSDEDREQFAQLIGYSLMGFEDLPYSSIETLRRVWAAARRHDRLPEVKKLLTRIRKTHGNGSRSARGG